MKLLCLNCRGLGWAKAVRELRSLCELHRPWVVFLSETRFLVTELMACCAYLVWRVVLGWPVEVEGEVWLSFGAEML